MDRRRSSGSNTALRPSSSLRLCVASVFCICVALLTLVALHRATAVSAAQQHSSAAQQQDVPADSVGGTGTQTSQWGLGMVMGMVQKTPGSSSLNENTASHDARVQRLAVTNNANSHAERNGENDNVADDGGDVSSSAGMLGGLPGWIVFLIALSIVYFVIVLLLIFVPSTQVYLIYLHWIRPPTALFPLTDLSAYRLGEVGRNVQVGHLKGWHILPPGPPFNTASSSSSSSSTSSVTVAATGAGPSSASASAAAAPQPTASTSPASSSSSSSSSPPSFIHLSPQTPDRFETCLRAPGQRVLLFLHGNSGTRAFPSKRVDFIKLANAQLHAHVLAFDYSGFGDSGNGPPNKDKLYSDVSAIYAWLRSRVHATSTLIVYGQSLGSFGATYLACPLSSPVRASSSSSSSSSPTTNNNNPNTNTSNMINMNTHHHPQHHVKTQQQQQQGDPHHLTILDAPPASLVAAAGTHPAIAPFRALTRALPGIIRERHDSVGRAAYIATPLLVLHGRDDSMIHWTQGKDIARQASHGGNQHVSFTLFPGVGHVNVCAAHGYLDTVFRFVTHFEAAFGTGPTKTGTREEEREKEGEREKGDVGGGVGGRPVEKE